MIVRLAALLLLVLLCGPACAQDLWRDHAVYDLAATRDLLLGQTTISGSYTNNGSIPLPAPEVTFALYDADGQEVGRLVEHADADLAPGQTWHIRASTPLTFARYVPVTAVAPPLYQPMRPARVRRRRVYRAVVHARPAVKKPAPPRKKAYVYRKPQLYNWSKHRTPAQARRAREAEHPAPSLRNAQPGAVPARQDQRR